MRIRTRIASIAAAVAVIAAGGAATPATAVSGTVYPLAAAGSIDSIAVAYHGSDNRPLLHLVGWAANLNDGWTNGDTDLSGVELFVQGANGSHTTVAWAERNVFDKPRPDVRRVYPSVGPNQGFDVEGLAPGTGTLKVCARLYSLQAEPESVVFTCTTVTVPAKRTGFQSSPLYSANLGQAVTVGLTAPSGGTDAYSWWRYPSGDPGAMPTRIPGASSSSLSPSAALVGHAMFGRITTKLASGTVIEQSSDPIAIFYPTTTTPERVSDNDRYSTSVATSKKAFPDATAGVPVAYIASGLAFADALSAGAAAVHQHGTFLLTPPDRVDSRVAAELVRLHPARIVVAGGPASVSEAVIGALRALAFQPEVQRIGGADRYEVSRAVDADAFGASVPAVYLVNGSAYPDALAAAAAAGSTGRPVLLTDGSRSAPDAATAAILAGWGTTAVTIVGGTGSVSAGIANTLGSSMTVTRAGGADRFEAAVALAKTLKPTGVAYLANGLGYADGLTTAVLAFARPGALLLSRGSCSPASTIQGMFDTGVGSIVLVGGPGSEASDAFNLAC